MKRFGERLAELFVPSCAGLALGLCIGQVIENAEFKTRITGLEAQVGAQAKQIAELRLRIIANALPAPIGDSPITLTVEPR